MPRVVVETVVPGAVDEAYALTKQHETFPRYMKDVVSIEVLETEEHAQITAWAARFQGKIMRWKERDVFDDAAHTITYRQTEGDLKKFEGQWICTPEGSGTRITLSVDFDLGVPMLAGLLDPVARLVVKKNCEDMLAGIHKMLAASGVPGGPQAAGE